MIERLKLRLLAQPECWWRLTCGITQIMCNRLDILERETRTSYLLQFDCYQDGINVGVMEISDQAEHVVALERLPDGELITLDHVEPLVDDEEEVEYP